MFRGLFTSALFIFFAVGCGNKGANCEFQANGAAVCMGGMSMSFCSKAYDGEPTKANLSTDPTCQDLGYETECTGTINEIGDNYTAEHFDFYAASEADCATADGATIDHSK